MALNSQIALSLVSHETSAHDISSEMRVTPVSYGLILTTGSGANQAQAVYSDSYTDWAGSSVVPYLLAGLSDDRGTVAFSALKVIYVRNKGTDPLLISGTNFSSGPFKNSGKIEVHGGGVMLLISPTAGGWGAGASSTILADKQDIGASADFDIMMIGEGTVS